MSAKETQDGKSLIFAVVEVSGKEQLGLLVEKLKRVSGVVDISRTTG